MSTHSSSSRKTCSFSLFLHTFQQLVGLQSEVSYCAWFSCNDTSTFHLVCCWIIFTDQYLEGVCVWSTGVIYGSHITFFMEKYDNLMIVTALCRGSQLMIAYGRCVVCVLSTVWLPSYIYVFLLVCHGKCWNYMEPSHDRFLPWSFHFIISLSCLLILYSDSAIK